MRMINHGSFLSRSSINYSGWIHHVSYGFLLDHFLILWIKMIIRRLSTYFVIIIIIIELSMIFQAYHIIYVSKALLSLCQLQLLQVVKVLKDIKRAFEVAMLKSIWCRNWSNFYNHFLSFSHNFFEKKTERES